VSAPVRVAGMGATVAIVVVLAAAPGRTRAMGSALADTAASNTVPSSTGPLGSAPSDTAVASVVTDAPALPLPVEEIESPERLEEGAALETACRARVTVRDGATLLRRVTLAGRSAALEAGVTVDQSVPGLRTGTIVVGSRGPGWTILAGRIASRATGSLFSESLGLAHRAGRVPVLRAELPTLEAPAGVSSPAVGGLGFRIDPRPGRFHPAFWGLAGRDTPDRIPAAAFGILIGNERRARGGVSVGVRGRDAALSGLARYVGPAFRVGAEGALARRKRAVLLTVETARSPLRLGARWRYRSSDARPVSCELTAAAGTRTARTLVRVSGVPSGPYGTAGRAEVESRLAARDGRMLSLRCGRSVTTGFSSASGPTERRERYLVLDAALAQSEGRAFSVLVSRRMREGAVQAGGATLGGRLEWIAPRERATLLVLVEADRADALGGEAWGTDLYGGGAVALRGRTHSGVHSAARGSLRVGRWRIGGLVESREDASGRSVAAGTLTLERLWSREAP